MLEEKLGYSIALDRVVRRAICREVYEGCTVELCSPCPSAPPTAQERPCEMLDADALETIRAWIVEGAPH